MYDQSGLGSLQGYQNALAAQRQAMAGNWTGQGYDEDYEKTRERANKTKQNKLKLLLTEETEE